MITCWNNNSKEIPKKISIFSLKVFAAFKNQIGFFMLLQIILKYYSRILVTDQVYLVVVGGVGSDDDVEILSVTGTAWEPGKLL